MKYLVLSLVLLSSLAYAAPALFDNAPVNNSYVGRGVVNFYINISSPGLDSSNVFLFVISEDAYNNQEPWDNYTMSCALYAAENWRCSRAVSFSIAGSDTREFFYFQANDSGGTSILGPSQTSLNFSIDRTPPVVYFRSPENDSYAGGMALLDVTVVDGIAGVNISSLNYSLDGTNWYNFTYLSGMSQYTIVATSTINTLVFQNNQTVTLRVNAGDMVGNSGVTSINFYVDNENPSITAVSPLDGAFIKDETNFIIAVSDMYSGVDFSKVYMNLSGENFTMSCVLGQCNASVNTELYADGKYNVTFYAYDNIGNYNTKTITVEVKNLKPSMAVSPKGYSKANPLIVSTITNTYDIVTGVSLRVEKDGSVSNYNMSCNQDFTMCTQLVNTSVSGDGIYTINATLLNLAGHDIKDNQILVVDSVDPLLEVTLPDSFGSTVPLTAKVTDVNNDRSGVTFSILGNSKAFSCVPQDDVLYCSLSYSASAMQNGRYTATVNATDLAGNSAVYTKEISVTGGSSGTGGIGGGGVARRNNGTSGNGTTGNGTGGTSGAEDVSAAANQLYDFAGNNTPLFLTIIAVVIIGAIVGVFVWKKRHPYY